MTRESTDKCASCDQFPVKEAVNNGGAAVCAIRSEVHRWDDRCVLHNRASDWRSRRDIVRELAKNNEGE